MTSVIYDSLTGRKDTSVSVGPFMVPIVDLLDYGLNRMFPFAMFIQLQHCPALSAIAHPEIG
jgi:hypothetical protein